MRFLTFIFVFGFAALSSALPADSPLPLRLGAKAPALNASLIGETVKGVVGASGNGVKNILGDAANLTEGVVGASGNGVKNILGEAANLTEGVVGASGNGVKDILGDIAKLVKGVVDESEEPLLLDAAEPADEEEEAEAAEESEGEEEEEKEPEENEIASNKTSSSGIRIPRLGIRTHIGVVLPKLKAGNIKI